MLPAAEAIAGFEGAAETEGSDDEPLPAANVFAKVEETTAGHVVPFIGRVAATTAGGAVMPHMGLGHKENELVGGLYAETIIHIFIVHEESLIEQADGLEAGAAD